MLLLAERVAEAQRFAAMEMRSKERKGGKGGRRAQMGDVDDAAAAEPELQRMIEQAGRKKRRRA